MKTQEPLSPAEMIAAADAEIAEAEALEQTLEQRVIEGDESIDAGQVEAARGVKRFAVLRRQAAERKAVALAEKIAAKEFEALLAEHTPYLTGRDEKLEPILAKIRPLLDQAIEIALEHDRHIYALASRADTVGNEWNPDTDPRLIGAARPTEYVWASVDGVRADVLGVGGVVKRLLAPYGPRFSATSRYAILRELLS